MRTPSSAHHVATLLLATLTLTACGGGAAAASGSAALESADASAEPARELIKPRAGLYAEASRAGNLVWTAGHLPEALPSTASVEEQVNEVLDSLEETLEEAGAGFDTVVHANVYLTSFDDWEALNATFFERMNEYGLPPRSTVAVSELGLGYRVEIEMVAVVREP